MAHRKPNGKGMRCSSIRILTLGLTLLALGPSNSASAGRFGGVVQHSAIGYIDCVYGSDAKSLACIQAYVGEDGVRIELYGPYSSDGTIELANYEEAVLPESALRVVTNSSGVRGIELEATLPQAGYLHITAFAVPTYFGKTQGCVCSPLRYYFAADGYVQDPVGYADKPIGFQPTLSGTLFGKELCGYCGRQGTYWVATVSGFYE